MRREDQNTVSETNPASSGEFIRLFLQNERRIYAFIVSLLPDLTDAEDVLQETSVVLWEKFDQFQPGTNFVSWACKIAHFKVLKHFDKKKRGGLRFNEQTLQEIADEASAMTAELDDRHVALADCLKKLPKKDRDLLNRRYAKETPVKTLAEEVGRSVHAIYKALPRIHGLLFDCISRRLTREAQA